MTTPATGFANEPRRSTLTTRVMRHHSSIFVIIVVAAVFIAAAWAGGAFAPPAQAAVLRGIDDSNLLSLPTSQRSQQLSELTTSLRASVLRLDCQWALAEPARGQYTDSGYLGRLVATATAAHKLGLKIIVTMGGIPKWASASSFWRHPPAGYSGYQPFYPMATSATSAYQAFAAHLATDLKGVVLGFEAYNEPNLWTNLYPQRTASDSLFAVDTYLRYLKAFSAGIRSAHTGALVIAGSTAPTGDNDIFRTDPLTFARALAARGAARYFDVYAHHPYVPGCTINMNPAAPAPVRTITLANIAALLRVFPTKAFYLTEYGYSTQYSIAFGAPVSEAQQAAYLTEAYTLAARYGQIKMLVWGSLQDSSPSGRTSDARGSYYGLRRINGTAKPAWYAFAGNNHLTLLAPTSVRYGALARLYGRLTCASVGGVAGQHLVLQLQRGTHPWVTLGTVSTGSGGNYAINVTISQTERFRLVWPGVVTSCARLIRSS